MSEQCFLGRQKVLLSQVDRKLNANLYWFTHSQSFTGIGRNLQAIFLRLYEWNIIFEKNHFTSITTIRVNEKRKFKRANWLENEFFCKKCNPVVL